jgi:putative transposase
MSQVTVRPVPRQNVYTRRMNDLRKTGFRFFRYNSCHDCVASTFPRLVGQRFPYSREDLVLENLALRRQLLALHAQQPRRRLTALHKLFWVALRTFWSGWTKPLIFITLRTVVNWHCAGFRLYWTWVFSSVSQVGGRKRVSKEVRALIFRMVSENPTWGAPRIHGELIKLGFDLSERTVSRWIQRAPRDPDPLKRWLRAPG